MAEMDEYTKCTLVGTATTPIRLSEGEIEELVNCRAFKNIRRQACEHVRAIITKMADPKTTEVEWRCAQGEFAAMRWLIQSKAKMISDAKVRDSLKPQKAVEAARNEQGLDTLLEGTQHGEEQ